MRRSAQAPFGVVGLLGALLLVCAVILAALFVVCTPAKSTVTYKNKPLEAWFYGSKTNFFAERTRRAAQEAFDATGTNAGAFLLSKLKMARGNNPLKRSASVPPASLAGVSPPTWPTPSFAASGYPWRGQYPRELTFAVTTP